MEVGTEMLKKTLTTALEMDIGEARRYLDSIIIGSTPRSAATIAPIVHDTLRGSWFAAKKSESQVVMLYLHGGGYCFYPRAYTNFIALITLAARSRTFALDYRLTPEHRFPAQLDDALNAYRWLMESGTDPRKLVLAGDSAGGNLALALLLALRDAKLPMPALTITLSPATDFTIEHMNASELDWVEPHVLQRWADWFCEPVQRRSPLISPVYADLRGLPPIYVQAGRGEVLFDSIWRFADCARNQGANVALESWEYMNHDFQIFGFDAPLSSQALQRIREVIGLWIPGFSRNEAKSNSTRGAVMNSL